MTIIATIIVLGVLIFVHELGHFLAARSVGVRVDRFSIGLGPRVWGFQRGETEYVLSAIPLGGYVKMGGMDDEVLEAIEGGKAQAEEPTDPAGEAEGSDEEGGPVDPEPAPRPRRTLRTSDFDAKPVWARAWVISAGVIMNMLFAFGAYAVVAAGWGSTEVDTIRVGQVAVDQLPQGMEGLAQIPEGAYLQSIGDVSPEHWGDVRQALLDAPEGPLNIRFAEPDGEVTLQLSPPGDDRRRAVGALGFWVEPELVFVEPGAPAHRAGIRSGDRIAAVGGERVTLWSEVQSKIQARPDQDTEITVIRNGEELTWTVTPASVEAQTPDGEMRTVGQIGVQAATPITYSPVPPVEAVRVGWEETVGVTVFILNFLGELVTGQVSARNLGSIVTIGEASGQAAAEGLPFFLRFMALFSINLAILNLLPIPILDGGHLVFLGIEAVRGRPVSVEQRMRWSQVGFVILLGIMALALGNDFLRLFGL